MDANSRPGDESRIHPAAEPRSVDPVDLAEFGRLTSAPPSPRPGGAGPLRHEDADGGLPPPPPSGDESSVEALQPPPAPEQDPAWYGPLEGAEPGWGYGSGFPGEPHPPAATAGPEMAPSGLTGPVGRRRSVLLVAVLSIVTLGLYLIFWHSRANREMSDFDFSLDIHPGRTAAALAIAWLLAFAVTAAGVARIVVQAAHIALPFDPQISADQAVFLLPAILLAPLLIALLPFSLVAAVMTVERVRLVEAHSGLPTDEQVRPASLVWCLLVPIAGGALLIAREQRRLNATWARAASRAAPQGWGYNYA